MAWRNFPIATYMYALHGQVNIYLSTYVPFSSFDALFLSLSLTYNIQILSGPVSIWVLFSASSVRAFIEVSVFTSPRSARSTWTSGTRRASTSCNRRATISRTATTRPTWARGCLKRTPHDPYRMLQSEYRVYSYYYYEIINGGCVELKCNLVLAYTISSVIEL